MFAYNLPQSGIPQIRTGQSDMRILGTQPGHLSRHDPDSEFQDKILQKMLPCFNPFPHNDTF